MFPQAVYFPIRTLYLTLKIEQREKHKSAEQVLASKLNTGVRYFPINYIKLSNLLNLYFFRLIQISRRILNKPKS